VASLKKILTVFGLSLADFFSDEVEHERRVFFRAAELTLVSKGPVMLRQVGKSLHRSKLQVLHETYAPKADTGDAMLSHDGEEAGVVVRGEIEITVGAKREVLGPGDAYYFHSKLPHRFRNRGKVECELISVCTPPTF
jgi:mannose-6-phosphate isomerase-like protein (cupin superfamily)